MRWTTLVVTLLTLLVPRSSAAWGFDVHRFIMDRAIDLVPPEIREFYRKHRVYLVEHSIDPDLWRNAGFTEEPPRHFLDLDAYGPYPFSGLPHDYAAAVKKFGAETITKNGMLPWRAGEIYGRLREAFQQQRDGSGQYALENIKFFSSVIGHYVSDAHVPFHAVLNHDGQLTGQHGIHARFETELFGRFRERLSIKPAPIVSVPNARDFVFATLLASSSLVPPVLEADRRAAAGRKEYDDPYFAQFFGAAQPILERRLGESISGVASVIAAAWQQAGRPALPLDPRRPPQEIRGR